MIYYLIVARKGLTLKSGGWSKAGGPKRSTRADAMPPAHRSGVVKQWGIEGFSALSAAFFKMIYVM